ncbi:MAG: YraN family protein [Parvularculaceae bacterium]|nr:YraN family protein [Parvularculaceae bacterium]
MTRDRGSAERHGRWAERLAAILLAAKGYRVLARRFRSAGGEIDLVARRQGVLVFVEVKARPRFDEAVLAVTFKARRRIEAAARAFAARHPRYAEDGFRYDIVAVSGWRVRHVVDAWREGQDD